MRFKNTAHNTIENIKKYFIKYAYVFAAIIGLSIYSVLFYVVKIELNENFMTNLINISGILAGFLFTSLGIIISLPDNKFTQQLTKTGYMKIIYRAMGMGIMSLLIAMMLGIFNIIEQVAKLFFITGISETFLSAYYLYRVSYYSGESK